VAGQAVTDVAGTAAAPAYSFSADPSSGMHLIGTSQLAFDTSGVTRMVISNSNVGIGTNAPTYTLDVASNARISGMFYAFSNAYISSNLGVIGNVGVGTSTPSFPLDLNIGKIGNVGTQAFSLISSTTTASNTFNYAGSLASWIVPSGVTSVTVYMWAGGGQTSRGNAGGGSAFVQGILTTTPGETLTMLVGAGGGTNGNYGGGGSPVSGDGGSGGGRSAIKRGSVEVVDVGAGGGGGVTDAGAPGVISAASTSSGTAQGGSATSNAPGQTGIYGNGSPGSQFQGGNGANYTGGGGAGYYGGGGGSTENRFTYGGGGGGSSLIANLTSTTNSTAGSGATPGGTGSAYYQSGIGVGSTSGVGGNGLIVVVYTTNVFSDYGSVAKDASSNMMVSATSNLRLNASNVGINQTQPLYPLDVSGTGRFTSNLITGNLLTGSGTANAPSHTFASDPSSGMHLIGTSQLAFDTSGVSRMVISNSNVGIGTSAPTVSLDVAGLMRSRIITSNLTDISFSADLTSTTGNSVYYYMTNVGFNKLTLTNPGVGNYNGIYGVFKNATTTGMSIDVCYNGAIGAATPLSLYSSNAITLIWNGSTYIQF
jgi:hypothetical protein